MTFPTPDTTLNDLDRKIAERSILRHPFYKAWQAGTLTRDQLGTYAAVYYPHVAAFPGYLSAAVEGATDAVVRAELLANLGEEMGEPAPHQELWLRFAAGVGADVEEIRLGEAGNTAPVVGAFRALCERSSASALSALYAYESQQPEVSRQKADGLRRFYGISDPATLEYFEVHAEADQRHRDGERRALARCLERGAPRQEVLAAAERALDAYWSLLDDVCARTGISTC